MIIPNKENIFFGEIKYMYIKIMLENNAKIWSAIPKILSISLNSSEKQ